MADEDNYWYKRGFSAAQRGFNSTWSPTFLEVGSTPWLLWHAGHAAASVRAKEKVEEMPIYFGMLLTPAMRQALSTACSHTLIHHKQLDEATRRSMRLLYALCASATDLPKVQR